MVIDPVEMGSSSNNSTYAILKQREQKMMLKEII